MDYRKFGGDLATIVFGQLSAGIILLDAGLSDGANFMAAKSKTSH